MFYLIPVEIVSDRLLVLLQEFNNAGPGLPWLNPNGSMPPYQRPPGICDTDCNQEYRSRISDALDEFGRKAKEKAPPITWKNAACFAGCAPALLGTPALYLACVLGCNGAVAAGDAIDVAVLANELEAAKENARVAYCACIAAKAAQCDPIDQEVDVVGCD